MRWFPPLLAWLLCSCSTQDGPANDSAATCAAGTKQCGSACVAIDLPEVGCAASSCEPCPGVAHGASICVQGSCAVTCEEGWADCDRVSDNGCEADLKASELDCGTCGNPCNLDYAQSACESGSCVLKACEDTWKDCDAQTSDGCEANIDNHPAHCGACGKACAQGELCYQGKCAKNEEAQAWLDTRKGGWCLGDYKTLVNLCGKTSVCHLTLCGDLDTDPAGSASCYDDYQHEHEKAVPFCCDTRFLKAYPNGIAVDVGFHYDGASIGQVLGMGGDVTSGLVYLALDKGGRLYGSVAGGGTVETTLIKGSYLVSFVASTSRTALYVNGLLADEASGAASEIVLATDHGPGIVLGARMSYWWEHPGDALRFAPFLFHLREGVPAGDWSLKGATEPSASTLLMFANQGISGNTWTAVVGSQTAYAVPQDDVTSNPVWLLDAASQCF